jgi:hypothetical protein
LSRQRFPNMERRVEGLRNSIEQGGKSRMLCPTGTRSPAMI